MQCISRFIYPTYSKSLPKKAIKAINKATFNYIWKRKHTIWRKVLWFSMRVKGQGQGAVSLLFLSEVNDEEENNKVYWILRMLSDSMAWWKTPIPFSFCVFILCYYIFFISSLFHFIYACYLMISNFQDSNIVYVCKLCFKCSIKFERKKNPSADTLPRFIAIHNVLFKSGSKTRGPQKCRRRCAKTMKPLFEPEGGAHVTSLPWRAEGALRVLCPVSWLLSSGVGWGGGQAWRGKWKKKLLCPGEALSCTGGMFWSE